MTRFIDDVVFISIQNNILVDSTCGFYYTIRKSNLVTEIIPENNYLQNQNFKLSSSIIKHQSHSHPNKLVPCLYNKYFCLLYRQWIPHPWKHSTSHHQTNFVICALLHFRVEAQRWSRVEYLSWLPILPDSQWTIKLYTRHQ